MRGLCLLALFLVLNLLPAPAASALTAAAVTWQSVGNYQPQSAASIATAAPNLYDGSVGDTATGYSVSSTGLYALWDMGSPVSLSGYQLQFTNAYYCYAAYYSTDGVNWTALPNPVSGSKQTFSAVTARYVQFILCGSPTVTDTRLYDGNGTLVGGPGSTPDFTLSAAASSQSIAPGQSGAADTLTLSSLNGFTAAAALSAACAQAGLTESFTAASVTPAANATASSDLTLAVATGTPPGTYPVTVTAVSGALTHTATVSVTVLGPPAAPTTLTAAAGNGQARLSWTAPAGSGITCNVFEGTSAGGESAAALATGLTSPAYTVSGLTNGTAYYFTVQAVNSLGTSPASNEAVATPAPALTAAAVLWQSNNYNSSAQPAGSFTASAPNLYDGSVGDTSTGYSPTGYVLDILWDMGSPVSLSGFQDQFTGAYYGYSAYYSTDGNNWTSLPSPVSGSKQTFSAVTVRYIQFVFMGYPAVTDTRLYDASGALVLAPVSVPPPATPTNLTATGGNSQAALSWTAPAGVVSSYNVKRSAVTGGPYTTISAAGAVTTTAYTDATAVNGTTYYYVVSAVNPGGESPNSAEASAALPLLAPAAPTHAAAAVQSGQIVVSWTAPPGPVTGCQILRGTSPGGESATPVATLTGAPPATTWTDPTATTVGATYYYKVIASNPAGSSPASNEAAVTLAFTAAPAAPTNFLAAGRGGLVNLTWTPSAGATSYNLYRGLESFGEDPTPLQTGLTGGSFTDSTGTNGTQYFYLLTAVSSLGESVYSLEASADPDGSNDMGGANGTSGANGTAGSGGSGGTTGATGPSSPNWIAVPCDANGNVNNALVPDNNGFYPMNATKTGHASNTFPDAMTQAGLEDPTDYWFYQNLDRIYYPIPLSELETNGFDGSGGYLYHPGSQVPDTSISFEDYDNSVRAPNYGSGFYGYEGISSTYSVYPTATDPNLPTITNAPINGSVTASVQGHLFSYFQCVWNGPQPQPAYPAHLDFLLHTQLQAGASYYSEGNLVPPLVLSATASAFDSVGDPPLTATMPTLFNPLYPVPVSQNEDEYHVLPFPVNSNGVVEVHLNGVLSGQTDNEAPYSFFGPLGIGFGPLAAISTASINASIAPLSVAVTLLGTTKDTDGSDNILIGQGCTAITSVVSSPVPITLSNFQWTIPGDTFSSFVMGNTQGSGLSPSHAYGRVTYLSAADLTSPTPHWFWKSGRTFAVDQTVSCTATVNINGIAVGTVTSQSNVAVWAPYHQFGYNITPGSATAYQGNGTISAATESTIDFSGSVGIEQLFYSAYGNSGVWQFTQLCNLLRTGPPYYWLTTNNEAWLDAEFNYSSASGSPWTADSVYQAIGTGAYQTLHSSSDSPNQSIYGPPSFDINDTYLTYQMYLPPGSDVSWVPLHKMVRNWNAQLTVLGLTWSPTIPGTLTIISEGPSSEFPTWENCYVGTNN